VTGKSGEIHVGISGWRYDGWRGTFFPKGLKQATELRYASILMQTIEINYDETPRGFTFSMKGGRYLTHMLRDGKPHDEPEPQGEKR